jgi:hypothetical protein
MGRSLAELLGSYLDEEVEERARRAPTPELRAVLETALQLAAAVSPGSVVGIAYSPGAGPTIVRLGGVRDIDRSLALGDRLADDGSRGLADARAEHLVLRAGDRLRLGVDRGGELDAEQRGLLDGVALLASRALARSGVVPLGATGRAAAPPRSPGVASPEGTAPQVSGAGARAGPDQASRNAPSSGFGVEVA